MNGIYPQVIFDFAQAIKTIGGRVWLVGGSVRDEMFGLIPEDFDIEVHGLVLEKVQEIAKQFGVVKGNGKFFGVLTLLSSELEIDIALPRIDSKVREGHRGFVVRVDPNMSLKKAAKRRDFTINAMMKDPLTNDVVDPFNGQKDLIERVLRVVDLEQFGDDPLRILRGAQFVGRFGLHVDQTSFEVMKEVVPRLKELSRERIQEEWNKMLIKSKKPSIALHFLEELGVISKYYSLLKTNWKAILAHLDETAAWLKDKEFHLEESLDALWCVISYHVDDYEKFLFSVGIGLPQRRRIHALCKVITDVPDSDKLSDGQIRQLARQVYPANLLALSYFLSSQTLYKKAKELGVLQRRPDTVIRGKDLILLGLETGPGFRKIINKADNLRDKQGLSRIKILEILEGVESISEALERLKVKM